MITFEEAGRLLALAAARDQRTVGDADVLAWHSDLNTASVSYTDAEAALAGFYVEQARLQPRDRFRATTPDVIAAARRIREQRLANFVYEPDGDETTAQYLTRRRIQITAVADGRIPAGGPPPLAGGPHPDVAKALAGVGRVVADRDPAEATVARPGPLGVRCPKCSAAIGRSCRRPARGDRLGKECDPHPARARVAAGEPGELEDPAEIARRRAVSAAKLAELKAEGGAS